MIQVTDLVIYRGEKYRVKYHLKRVEDRWETMLPASQREYEDNSDGYSAAVIDEIIEEDVLKEKLRRESLGLPHTRRYRLQYCGPEEATHVSLGTCHALISEIEYEGPIIWSPERIAECRASAVSEFWLRQVSDWYWE